MNFQIWESDLENQIWEYIFPDLGIRFGKSNLGVCISRFQKSNLGNQIWEYVFPDLGIRFGKSNLGVCISKFGNYKSNISGLTYQFRLYFRSLD